MVKREVKAVILVVRRVSRRVINFEDEGAIPCPAANLFEIRPPQHSLAVLLNLAATTKMTCIRSLHIIQTTLVLPCLPGRDRRRLPTCFLHLLRNLYYTITTIKHIEREQALVISALRAMLSDFSTSSIVMLSYTKGDFKYLPSYQAEKRFLRHEDGESFLIG